MTVALWEPDITPRDDWLLPSVLYQEKIATFAPPSYVQTPDGREAEKLRAALGDLYQPLSLGDPFQERGEGIDELLELLERAIPDLRKRVASETVHISSGEEQWLERSRPKPSITRPQPMQNEFDPPDVVLEDARIQAATLKKRIADLNVSIEAMRQRRKALHEKARPHIEEQNAGRNVILAPLLERRCESATSQEYDVLDQEIRARRREFSKRQSLEIEDYRSADREFKRALKERKQTSIRLREVNEEISRLLSVRVRAQERKGWRRNPPNSIWHDEDNWWLPRGMDTIAPGKIHGEVFDFLATDGGMWVYRCGRDPDSGTLVGPKRLVKEVLSIIAQWYCTYNDGWTPMCGDFRIEPPGQILLPRNKDELVTLAINYWTLAIKRTLPVPTGARLEKVVEFRLNHEEELRMVRNALASELPSVTRVDDLKDAVTAAKLSIAEPLAEIDHALKLDRSLGRRAVRQAVLYKSESVARDLIDKLAAGGIGYAISGQPLDIAGIEHAPVGGILIAFFALSSKHLWTLGQRRRAQRGLAQSPYRYIYEVRQAFEPA